MINWTYNPEDYGKIKPITPGQYRVRIESAEEAVSKNSGLDMIKLTLKVSGHNQKVFYYVVFPSANEDGIMNPEEVERTNNKLGAIFDSFGLTPGDLNLLNWNGKVGAAEIVNKPDKQGNMRSEPSFFIKRDKQGFLPAWQENPVRQATVNSEMVNPNSYEPPF